jgi:hypothetical protein
MRITLLSTLAVLSLTGTALAADAPVPAPVSSADLDRAVSVDVSILDAAGTTVDTLSCDWSTGGPQAEDRTCLRFQSDAQVAFAAIEEAGGVRAEQHTVTDGADMAIAYSRRGDGTWLIRSKGTVDGQALHFGRVCTADGRRCVRWDADGAQHAATRVRAAAAKLTVRR